MTSLPAGRRPPEARKSLQRGTELSACTCSLLSTEQRESQSASLVMHRQSGDRPSIGLEVISDARQTFVRARRVDGLRIEIEAVRATCDPPGL